MKKLTVTLLCSLLLSCGGGSNSPTTTTIIPSPPLITKSVSFEVSDSMWSWWVKPNLLRDVTATKNKTYVTFTQTDGSDGLAIFDHSTNTLKRYLIGTQSFTPDDHGAGSVVAGSGRLAVFIQGRDAIAPASAYSMYYVEFGENEDPTGLPLQSFPFSPIGVLNQGSNYPNTYNADGQFFLLSRMSTNLGFQWGYVLNTWPLTTFQPRQVFYASEKYTWPYFATHRSAINKNVFPFALGFHPFSSTFHEIFYGEIHRNGIKEPWDVISGDKVVGNMTTGVGLPFNETSFELVYTPLPGESTRLFNVSDNVIVFATFDSDNIGHYKYAIKRFGTWNIHDVVVAGLPFQGAGIRNYYGGMSISTLDSSIINLSREENGSWYIERYKTSDDGVTWTRLFSIPYSNNIVAGRPMDEQLSDESDASLADLIAMYWYGYYDYNDYTKFATTLTTVNAP